MQELKNIAKSFMFGTSAFLKTLYAIVYMADPRLSTTYITLENVRDTSKI